MSLQSYLQERCLPDSQRLLFPFPASLLYIETCRRPSQPRTHILNYEIIFLCFNTGGLNIIRAHKTPLMYTLQVFLSTCQMLVSWLLGCLWYQQTKTAITRHSGRFLLLQQSVKGTVPRSSICPSQNHSALFPLLSALRNLNQLTCPLASG